MNDNIFVPLDSNEEIHSNKYGRGVKPQIEQQINSLSVPSLLMPISRTPSPPPIIEKQCPFHEYVISIYSPRYQVNNVLAKMDCMFDATFSTWIKSEENIPISSQHLKRISSEYGIGHVIHGLSWLIQKWKSNSLIQLLCSICIEDESCWKPLSCFQETSNTLHNCTISQDLKNSERLEQQLRHIALIKSLVSKFIMQKKSTKRKRRNQLQMHAEIIQELIQSIPNIEQRLEFVHGYCMIVLVFYGPLYTNSSKQRPNSDIYCWSMEGMIEFIMNLETIPFESRMILIYSIHMQSVAVTRQNYISRDICYSDQPYHLTQPRKRYQNIPYSYEMSLRMLSNTNINSWTVPDMSTHYRPLNYNLYTRSRQQSCNRL